MKNSRNHFGYLPIDPTVDCLNVNTRTPEPFVNVLHLLSDEIYKSEVDVVIRSKKTKEIVGVLGRVTELNVSVGQPWFRIDSTEAQPEVIKYLIERIESSIPLIGNKPYLVSEHINFLNPVIRVYVSEIELHNDIKDYVASWIDIEV